MKLERGNLWDHYDHGGKVVITTNVGWDLKDLRNNMGAGMAWQAARRFPWLPEWYGRYCRLSVLGRTRGGSSGVVRSVPVVEHERLIFFPVKPLLDYGNPERSWDQQARLDVIRVSLSQLTRHRGQIALGLPGCGNGGLAQEDVLPLVRSFLRDDRFTLCDQLLVGDAG